MWNVILGAAIALAGAFAVQVWVIPPVARRSRRLDRWEDDVLALGTIASTQLANAREDAYAAWIGWRAVRKAALDRGLDTEDSRLTAVDRDRSDNYRRALRDYERVVGQLDLLASRIAARDSRYGPYLRIQVDVMALRLTPAAFIDWTDDGIAKADASWKTEAENRRQLLKNIEKLSSDIAPPSPNGGATSLRRRAKTTWKRVTQRFRRSEGTEGPPKR